MLPSTDDLSRRYGMSGVAPPKSHKSKKIILPRDAELPAF
jgi:hypothetical protein